MKDDGIKLNVPGEDAVTSARSDAPALHRQTQGQGRRLEFDLDVVSDVACPWCRVGKRRLAKALNLLGDEADVRVGWRPFQLNPSMPREGIDRREYRTRKFGSWEYSLTLDARLAVVGRAEGLDFRFDRMARTPDTLDAHRLIGLGGRLGVQDAVAEALFRAYFSDGVDLGRRDNLVTVAVSAGVPAADAKRVPDSDDGVIEVLTEERMYGEMGIEGVPAFVVGGTVAVSGAAVPGVMAEAFRRSLPGGAATTDAPHRR